MTGDPSASADRAWSRRGGYVRGFEDVFRAEGFEVPTAEVAALDPLFQWVLHCGREALSQARRVDRSRTTTVLGNLSFPSQGMARYADAVWRGQPDEGNPHDRFMSGLPAAMLARGLGLGGDAWCLDAACASALYAIRAA